MDNGRVYWITGLSNSGKTTIGTALYYDLKKTKNNVIILDGDIMKEIASGTETASFEEHDRLLRAKRYSKVAKLLANQGMWVIVCAIAMFDEIREWNRKNMKGYIEVFLDVPNDVLKERDRKGLYQDKKDVQFPKNPDIVIRNDGEISIRNIIKMIKELVPEHEEDYDRDREYWNHYYRTIENDRISPSNFAIFVHNKLKEKSHILELGCGNGRDSLYFLKFGHNVTAVDASNIAIERLNDLTVNNKDALFVCDDFVKCESLFQMKYDCIYSRFTLHAITVEQENELLINVKSALNQGGLFCIEARTTHDDIYGVGEKIAHNTFIHNKHFRRFVNVDEFVDKLKYMGFIILSVEEKQGFSKSEDSDPVLMRCIASIE